MAELIVWSLTVFPLWIIAWLLWRHFGEPGRKQRARLSIVYFCNCAYLGGMEVDERTDESPWPCQCATGCYVEPEMADCPCQCRTRGCYQELVYQGYRE